MGGSPGLPRRSNPVSTRSTVQSNGCGFEGSRRFEKHRVVSAEKEIEPGAVDQITIDEATNTHAKRLE